MSFASPLAPRSPVRYESHGRIGVLRIANPPVNALSADTIAGLIAGFSAFEADTVAKALLVHCDGNTFVAGGDITAFDDPEFSAQPYNQLLARLEASPRPVIAALHGTALGGGLELALACHGRVAHPSTRVGVPEVKLGLLPGSLGTQRLPRLVGVALALDMMLTGRMVDAREALEKGVVDALCDGDPLAAGLTFAEGTLAAGTWPRRLSAQRVPDADPRAALEQAAGVAAGKTMHPAHAAIVRCVQAAVDRPFAQGEQIEAREFDALRKSPESRALRHLFFAQRQAAKVTGLVSGSARREVRAVGVLGAGTMGTGIAMCFINAGLPTTLVETSQAALERGLGVIRSTYEASAAKGRITAAQLGERMALVKASLDDRALAACDLVIEAVFEDLDLKTQVCARLGQLCKPGAIIATNTSTLDVDMLAQATGRVADVVGMHFFSPAHVMRLLEVVRGEKTAPEVLSTVMRLARIIDKVAVVSGVCYGFIGNRMAEVYMREAEFLLMEGATPAQVDGAVEALGMAMGPCRMLDMAGIDVGARTVIEYGKAGGLPPDGSYRAVVRRMFELGRFGQKTGAGYYRYEGRKALPDPATLEVAEQLARQHGVARRAHIDEQEIVERLLYPLINEGARILEERIAYRAGDIDVVWTSGYGFPNHQGGPMFMAGRIGLPQIVARLKHYADTRGNSFGYWDVSALLAHKAERGESLFIDTRA